MGNLHPIHHERAVRDLLQDLRPSFQIQNHTSNPTEPYIQEDLLECILFSLSLFPDKKISSEFSAVF
jgi:hypothetical protein